VRTRRYFYAHTTLAGHAFDYLANPIAILKGNLILAAGFILLAAAQQVIPRYEGIVALGVYVVIPYLIYTSLRYRLYNSSYRNIRMQFRGSLGESYAIYFWWPMLIPLTLGLIFPYINYRKKKYAFANMAYGTTQNQFDGKPMPFYAMYLLIFAVLLIFVVAFIVTFGELGGAISGSIKGNINTMTILFASGYLALLFITSSFQQYIYVQSNNYCWNHSTLGHVRFHSTLRTWPLVGIRITNLLAIIVSLGLLMPWAKIRRARYILSHLHIVVSGDLGLDQFAAARGRRNHAVGEVSADFLGLEVGL